MEVSREGKAVRGGISLLLAASLVPVLPGAVEQAAAAEAPSSAAAAAALSPQAEGDIALDEATFPDEGFREYIYYYISGKPDFVTKKDADAVREIDLSQTYYSIETIAGIEYFPNLVELNVSGMDLSQADLSRNTKLTAVDLSSNAKLASVNVAGLAALQSLDLSGTAVKSLNLSTNANLSTLSLSGTQLAYLDLSHTKVTALEVAGGLVGTARVDVAADGTVDLRTAFPGIDPTKLSEVQGATLNVDAGTLSGVTVGTPITYRYDMGNGVSGAFQLNPVKAGSTAYNVTFDANGGNAAVPSQSVGEGKHAVDPGAPQRDGYTFLGWYAPGAQAAWNFGSDTVTGDLKLTAKWNANTYTVRYHGNGEGVEGSVPDQQFTYDRAGSLAGRSAFTWEDHEFLGWSTTPDGEVEYQGGARVSNLTAEDGAVIDLYAVWKEIVPEVGLTVDENLIPDEAFRAWVKEYVSKGDILSEEERMDCTSINLDGAYLYYGTTVKDLTGLDLFPNITYLKVTQDDLTSIDLSKNTKIEELWLDNSPKLGELDVTCLPNLTTLSADECGLSEIDLTKASKLRKLYIMHNHLKSIDFSGNPELYLVHLSDNELTSLDTQHNPKLEALSAHTNKISSVDFSHNPNLRSVVLHTNELASIDLSHNPEVYWVEVHNNRLSSLDLTANPGLSVAKAWGNPLLYVNLPEDIDMTRFDKETEQDGPYTAEVPAYNGAIDISALGAGSMDPARIVDLQGATLDADAGTLQLPEGMKAGDVATVTYTYQANDKVTVRFKLTVPYVNRYTVTFDANGGTGSFPTQQVVEGQTMEKPADPVREGYTFEGWVPANAEIAWDFSRGVTSDLALTAQWKANSYTVHFDGNGALFGSMEDLGLTYDKEASLPRVRFGLPGYLFAGWAVSPQGLAVYEDGAQVSNLSAEDGAVVNLYATWKLVGAPATPTEFSDVDKGAWYADGVAFAARNELMYGYEGTDLFGVGNSLTRAELATILWRHEMPGAAQGYQQEAAKNETGLADVADGAYYTGAANWAVRAGIINGWDNGDGTRSFRPNDPVTLEQFASILANLNGGAEGTPLNALDRFADADGVSGWAAESVAWAADRGLVSGYEEPDGRYVRSTEGILRERAATLLYNAALKDII